jgi:hypothetical protein
MKIILVILFSNVLRVGVQAGDSSGSHYLLYVNGVNFANFTIPAAFVGRFFPDQFFVVNNSAPPFVTVYGTEFRYVRTVYKCFKALVCT